MDMNKFLDFTEQIAKDDMLKMQKFEQWENYIKPLFKAKFNKEYRSEYRNLYSKDWQKWIDSKEMIFDKTHK